MEVNGALERGGEASENTVFSGNSSSCCKSWLLASNKLPDSEPQGLSAGLFPVQSMKGTRLYEDLLALSCSMPTLTPWGADAMFPLCR